MHNNQSKNIVTFSLIIIINLISNISCNDNNSTQQIRDKNTTNFGTPSSSPPEVIKPKQKSEIDLVVNDGNGVNLTEIMVKCNGSYQIDRGK